MEIERGSRFSSIRERFQQELSTQEMRFLLGVFGKTSLRFFCFGLCVFGLNVILKRLLPSELSLFALYLLMMVVSLSCCIPLWFMRRKYDANPLSASASLRVGVIAMTSFIFVTCFLFLLHVYQTYVHNQQSGSSEVAGALLTAFVFGSAWIIYLIPTVVAWFFISRKQAIKLNKFICGCAMVLLPLVLVSLLCLFLGIGGLFFSGVLFLCMIIGTVLLLLCPIVTLYRFKVVSYAIDYNNEEEKKKWADYFGFVMLQQMLAIAIRIMDIAIRVLGRSR